MPVRVARDLSVRPEAPRRAPGGAGRLAGGHARIPPGWLRRAQGRAADPGRLPDPGGMPGCAARRSRGEATGAVRAHAGRA